MKRRLLSFLLLPALFASGCANTEAWEHQIAVLEFDRDAAQQQAEQAERDKDAAQRETTIAHNDNKILKERLALAYDALRDARTQLDTGMHDRLTELSEATDKPGGQAYEISQYGGIVLESGIFFAAGSHQLTPAGQQALKPLIAKLQEPGYAGYEIELAGHTDADRITRTAGKYRDNHDLASMRANSVRIFLLESGVAESRVWLSSWGPNHPLADADKAKNRRVEILLHKRDDDTTVPASSPRDPASQPSSTSAPAEGEEPRGS